MSTRKRKPVYQEVHAHRTVIGKCTACGLKIRLRKNFKMQVSPDNLADSGQPRTYDEVYELTHLIADAWAPAMIHAKCWAGETT